MAARSRPKPRDPARRRRILDAAKREFTAHGFKRTNLDDIARQARCAKGALYLEFPDKRALLREVVMETYAAVVGRFERDVMSVASPLERVVASLRFAYEESAREPMFTKLMREDPDLRHLGLPGGLVDQVRQQVELISGWLADAAARGELREGVDAAAIPFVLGALKYAPYHLEVVTELRLFSAERTLNAIVDTFRAGLAAAPSRSRRPA